MPHLPLTLTLALAAGLAGGVVIDADLTGVVSTVVASAWLVATLSFARAWPRLLVTSAVIAMTGAGWLSGAHAVERALHPPLRTLLEQRVGGFDIAGTGAAATPPVVIEGRLLEDATPTMAGAALRVGVDRVWVGACPESVAGGVSLGVAGALAADHLRGWTAGRVIRAPAILRRPARYLNEGLPDQERALARRGTTLVGSVKSAALVDVVQRGRWWEEAAAAIRARARQAIARHVHPRGPLSAGIATAILIGDRAGVDEETERRLQQAGTYHVIAISGGNIAILAGLVLTALKWMGVRGRAASLTAMMVLAAYAVVAAGGASVARATLMAAVYLAVRLIDQRTAALNAIGLTGGALLLFSPLSIVDIGFWLTFGATSAIVVGTSLVPSEWRAPGPSVMRRAMWVLAAVLAATICAELALAPASAWVFGRVTLAGLLLNFAALPAMTVVQVGALLVVAFDILGLQVPAAAMGLGVHWGTVVLTGSARFLDIAPWLTWRVPPPAALTLIIYYAALVTAAWLRRQRCRRRAAAAFAVAICAFLWIIVSPPARVRAAGDGRLHLSMLDVGQGDAMLVTFPDGRTLAVDAGGSAAGGGFDIGDRVVGPSLRARSLLRLDYLAVTHGDPDHVGGALSLLRDFAPHEVWWGVAVANHGPEGALRGEARRLRTTWRRLQRGDRLEIGGVDIRVHHPTLPDWERQKVRNDDSLVLELRFGEVSLLLTGDIGREVEAELVPALDLLPKVVVKVPHHGSATSSSSAFVERLNPAVALIGVGRGNSYGHPVPAVLERYAMRGTTVFRTDLDGQIDVATDGKMLDVSTFAGRNVRP
jgi:competence protein ComEC